MLSLREFLANKNKAAFARELGEFMGRSVSRQTLSHWIAEVDDPEYAVPRRKVVEAIEKLTAGEVGPGSWYDGGARQRRPAVVSSQASRKGWATRRRQREAQP